MYKLKKTQKKIYCIFHFSKFTKNNLGNYHCDKTICLYSLIEISTI